MDDRFMMGLKRTPDPEFARRLRDRLRLAEGAEEEDGGKQPVRWGVVLAPTLAVALLASVILFPSVRASAQAFLDLFRVRTFTAVSVSQERLAKLREQKFDFKTLIGERVEMIREPGEPQVVSSAAQAGAAAGFTVLVPTLLPGDLRADSVAWRGPGEARVTPDVARLRSLLETLDIRDLTVPVGLGDQPIDIKLPALVKQRFRGSKGHVEFLQARSPEVGLPAGVDMAALGEIGLRVLGVQPAEARRLAQTIDWRTTMLIPVPSNAGSFRQVQVGGQPGLMVTLVITNPEGRRREGAMVLWSRGDMVYGMQGNISGIDLLQMANSLQ